MRVQREDTILVTAATLRASQAGVSLHCKFVSNYWGKANPADPADRFFVATARAGNAILVTADQRILDYSKSGHVKALAP